MSQIFTVKYHPDTGWHRQRHTKGVDGERVGTKMGKKVKRMKVLCRQKEGLQ